MVTGQSIGKGPERLSLISTHPIPWAIRGAVSTLVDPVVGSRRGIGERDRTPFMAIRKSRTDCGRFSTLISNAHITASETLRLTFGLIALRAGSSTPVARSVA